MKRNEIRVTMGLCLIILLLAGCGDGGQTQHQSSKKKAVFDTGRGSGPYDKQTYYKYESEILFMPQTDITASSIKPDMWYCNGTCGYKVTISDESGVYLASQAGSALGNDAGDVDLPDGNLDSVVLMAPGIPYRIKLEAWTTRSVGVYTTGERITGILGQAEYSVVYAHAITPTDLIIDHIDRGGISFQILK